MDNNKHQTQQNKKSIPDKTAVRPINLEKYEDPEGLTLKKLNFGLWYVKHLPLFKKLGRLTLIIISVITWGLFFYTFGYYVLIGMRQDDNLLAQLANDNNGHAIHQVVLKNRPAELQIQPPTIFHNPVNSTYDFVSLVNNPNSRHWAHFVFFIYDNDKPIASSTGFILPQEQKYIMILGQKLSAKPALPKIVFTQIDWQRVNNKKIPNWAEFARLHLDFEIIDPVFIPPRRSTMSEKLPIGEISFTIRNNTPYNYQSVGLNILLWRRGQLVGANHHILDNVYSGHSYEIMMAWPGNVGNVDKVEVNPEIDITRDDIYLNFEAQGEGNYR